MSDELWQAVKARSYTSASATSASTREQLLQAHWGGFAWEQVARLQQLRAALEARAAGQTLYFAQAIDRPTGPTQLSRDHVFAALQVVNMTKTSYLLGMCPLYVGMPARVSCILPMPLLTRELPVIVRRIELHLKEPPVPEGQGCVVLAYQPLAVLVEVDDEEYRNYCLPGHEGVPPGHFFIRAISSENAWSFQTAGKEKISVVRKQVPLAPRCVLTHYGLQGVTARRGLVAFLSRPSWMRDADYALAMYVMLSRPRKLDDLWIIDLPERDVFEGHLHAHNTTLVERMQQFEAQALRDESRALSYVRKLGWHSSEFVSDLFPSGAFERRVRQKLRA